MTEYKEYLVEAHVSDVEYIKARNEKEAVEKAKKKMNLKPYFTIKPAKVRCSGRWRKGCTNMVDIFHAQMDNGLCQECRSDADDMRLNSPG